MSNPTPEHAEPIAKTAGQQDHSDVEQFRGEPADPPADTGKPAEDTP